MKEQNWLDQLLVDKNKIDGGWYSDDSGFISDESVKELKKIKSFLKDIGIECTLLEAQDYWSDYCTETMYASWIEFSNDIAHKEYASKYFKENQS